MRASNSPSELQRCRQPPLATPLVRFQVSGINRGWADQREALNYCCGNRQRRLAEFAEQMMWVIAVGGEARHDSC